MPKYALMELFFTIGSTEFKASVYEKVSYGYASLKDVRSTRSGKFDRMESFFIAETMKYMYLLHDPDQRK